jgi:hypothetical protein
MPEHVTIPISGFELSVNYAKPDVKLWVDRGPIVQGIFEALCQWNPNFDDIEVINVGKPSEQGVKLKVASRNISFFFGPTGCRLTKDAATWADADEMIRIHETALSVLAAIGHVAFARKIAILSLHLQPKILSFREILRPFLAQPIAKLEDSPVEAIAIVARWNGRRITLDGSAAIVNGVYVQSEREFESTTSYDEVKSAVLNDELALFKLLDLEEVAS